MMSPREMDTLLRNVDRRTARMEQILPTLATKDELAEVRRHATLLNEAGRGDIRMLAERVEGLIDSRSVDR